MASPRTSGDALLLLLLLVLSGGGGDGFGGASAFSTPSRSSSSSSTSALFPLAGRRLGAVAAALLPTVDATPSSLAASTSSSLGATLQGTGIESSASASNDLTPTKRYDSVIVGGGPAGLLSAIMLSQKFGPSHRIALYERRPDPPPSPDDETVWNDVARFYLLGLGHRGQAALRRFGVYDDFERASVPVDGRRNWEPGKTSEEDGIETAARKGVQSRILARDKLVGMLHHHILDNYKDANIELMYGYQVDPISFGDDEKGEDGEVILRVSRCEDAAGGSSSSYLSSSESEQLCDVDGTDIIGTNLLIAADGSARTIANAIEQHDLDRRSKLNPVSRLFAPQPFKVTRYVDDNARVFKSVPIKIPSHWKPNLNYSARSKGNRITLEALPSDSKGNICALLLMKPDDDFAQPQSSPAALRAFFEEEFPCFSALVDDEVMEAVAVKESSALPAFRYAGPRLNKGGRTVVLGDAAHTVKPYFGLGANTALEDVSFLSDSLDDAAAEGEGEDAKDAVPAGVRLFSDRRSGDAEALVTISRGMDRPGKLGTILFFVGPLILDSIFHKMAPAVFGPNMFQMFQKKGIGFRQIRRKKRLDRAMQMAVIGTVLTGMGVGVKAAVAASARALGKSQAVVGGTAAAVLVAASMLQKAMKKQEPEAQAS